LNWTPTSQGDACHADCLILALWCCDAKGILDAAVAGRLLWKTIGRRQPVTLNAQLNAAAGSGGARSICSFAYVLSFENV